MPLTIGCSAVSWPIDRRDTSAAASSNETSV
jgi:hypothetical protein